jgi:hypothetical protein
VIASGSKYFQEVFKTYPDMREVAVPAPYNQAYENNSDDQVIRIFKYFYANQDFKSIQEEISDKNIYALYSQAYAMRCDKLLQELNRHIISNMLSVNNVAHFLQESIEFEIPSL